MNVDERNAIQKKGGQISLNKKEVGFMNLDMWMDIINYVQLSSKFFVVAASFV